MRRGPGAGKRKRERWHPYGRVADRGHRPAREGRWAWPCLWGRQLPRREKGGTPLPPPPPSGRSPRILRRHGGEGSGPGDPRHHVRVRASGDPKAGRVRGHRVGGGLGGGRRVGARGERVMERKGPGPFLTTPGGGQKGRRLLWLSVSPLAAGLEPASQEGPGKGVRLTAGGRVGPTRTQEGF